MTGWYFVKKPLLLWDWDIRIGAGDIFIYPVRYSLYHTSRSALATHAIMKSMHVWLFAAALLSVLLLTRDTTGTPWMPASLYLSVVSISAVYCMAQSEPRYSVPMRPEMYILAAYFLNGLVDMYQKWRTSPGTQPTD